MKYLLKENEAEARERHRAFWSNNSFGRPVLHITAAKKDFKERPWTRDDVSRKECDLLPEWHINNIENYLLGNEFLAEAMPAASLMVGLDITNTAVLVGCDYEYEENREAIRYIRHEHILDKPVPAFSKEHYLVRGLRHCYQEAARAVKNKAYVNTPTTLDALTTLFMLLGEDRLCRELYRRPWLVRKRVEQVTELHLQFFEYFYNYLLGLGYGESSSWFHVFAEGKFESARCDFAVMLSPAMFGQFAVPELEMVCGYMDYSLYNLDSVCKVRFIDSLARVKGLNGIFWNPEPKESDIKKWIGTLREIKQKKMCLYLHCGSVEEAVFITRELGPDGLLLSLPAFSSRQDAEKAIDVIKRAVK